MKKRCPRCGALFDCLHDEDIRLCHCATVELDDQTRKYLKENYSDCLCHNCLIAIKKGFMQMKRLCVNHLTRTEYE